MKNIWPTGNLPSSANRQTFAAPGPSALKEQVDFGDNPGTLRMFAYTPPEMPENAPLVVVLHGCGQTAADYERGTGWVALARQLGFAILAPEQIRANNMNGCFNWFHAADTTRGCGEVASMRAMVEWMISHHHLNRGRIFITGLSAGGAMTAAMLAAYPEVFAGGAIIAGLPSGAASSMLDALNVMRHVPDRTAHQWGEIVRSASPHSGPWPAISIWHGDADAVVNAGHGEASLAQWADVHGVMPSESETRMLGCHRHRKWRAKDGKIAIEMVELAGVGHGVPVGGPDGQRYGEGGAYFFDGDIASTVHIAAFWGFAIVPAQGKAESQRAGAARLTSLPRTIGRTISEALKKAGLRPLIG